MDILICEDNTEQLYELKRIISKYITENDLPLNIYLATTKSEKMVQIIQTSTYQQGALFILDIRLGENKTNGFEIAKLIRENDPTSSIVFSTTHSDLVYLTFNYKVEALDYILKDDFENYRKRVIDCINLAYLKQKQISGSTNISKKILSFQIGSKILRVPEDNLIYAETSSNKHRLIIYTTNQQLEIYGSLDKLVTCTENLIRCHKSYIANKNKITVLDYNKMQIAFDNGMKCPVSRKYLNQVKVELKSELS